MSAHKAVSNETLLAQLKWRYATKKFDVTKKIPAQDWRTLEEALVLTPSSFGAQPWKFFVVISPELKASLVPASWGQRQPAECSHMLVLAIKKNLGADDIERYMRRTADVRGVPLESLDKFKNVILGFLERPKEVFDVNVWAKDQVYIALGNFMTCAALLGIDTCPMEGIDPKQYDEILGLNKLGYHACVACPAGYRAADGKYAATPKVRFPHEDTIAHL